MNSRNVPHCHVYDPHYSHPVQNYPGPHLEADYVEVESWLHLEADHEEAELWPHLEAALVEAESWLHWEPAHLAPSKIEHDPMY